MRILVIILSICFFSFTLSGQTLRTKVTAKSPTKRISYRTTQIDDTKSLKPDLEITNFNIFDNNSNRIIERDESANIELQIVNRGLGTAKDVYVRVKLTSIEIDGLEFKKEIFLGNIYSEETREIIFPIKGKFYLNTGIANFNVQLSERFGHSVEPINIKIGTHEYQQPNIAIKETSFSTDNGGKIQFNYPIYLKLLIENTSPKPVSNLEADIIFDYPGCVLLNEKKFIISSLNSNETVIKEIIFTAKSNYLYDIIPIKIHFYDKYKLYSETQHIELDINQLVASRNPSNLEHSIPQPIEIFVTDIDTGIPVDTVQYTHRYALIIGNENYTKHQPLLSNESNVIYAINDANTFKNYTTQTLGVPDENIFFLQNATYAEMKLEIERVSKILEKTGNTSELIFYYAGHGFPDENTKTPYLIPVDVSATNLSAAIKLADIYKRFSETGSNMITMFIDACFTGGGRESGLLAARAFTIEPKFEALQGNIIVFNSSSGTQSSLPYHDKKHGIFTYYLLKKIQETNGYISFGELSDYLNKTVSIESLRINSKEQDPKVNISSDVQDIWQDWSFK